MIFRNTVEDNEFSVKKDLIRKVSYVPAYPPYSVQRDQQRDHFAYDVFRSKDTKYMAKVLGDVLKSGSCELVFSSAIQLALCYKAIAVKKKQ